MVVALNGSNPSGSTLADLSNPYFMTVASLVEEQMKGKIGEEKYQNRAASSSTKSGDLG